MGKFAKNNAGNLKGPISYEFTWGLILLKALPKPPTPVKIFMPKSKWKMNDIYNNVVNNINNGI